MATTAESFSVKRVPAKAPVSTHPAFPAIVALWFAALLGLGSLVLPVALLERLVSVTGLAALIPGAAPPLGFTAQACVALGGAMAGALIGLGLARKVATAHASEREAHQLNFDEVRQCRPISAHDELGEEGLGLAADGPAVTAHKRRSLAMAEDNRRSTYLQTVPLPGLAVEEPSGVTPPAEAAPLALEDLGEAALDPLELGEFADLELAEENADDSSESEAHAALDALRSRIHFPVEDSSPQDSPMTDVPGFDIPQAFEPGADAADPLPFTPPSLRRAEAAALEEEEGAEKTSDASCSEEPAPRLSVIADSGEHASLDDDRPLAELGLVQLAARLGASLEKRKVWLASHLTAIAPAASPPAGAEDFEAAEAEDAARAIAEFFGPAKAEREPAIEAAERTPEPAAPAVPVSLRSLPVDADDEADDGAFAASFSLPLARTAARAEPVDEEETPEPTEEAGEDSDYSSLLEMKNPFVRQQEFVRVEEPENDRGAFEPTVTFPAPPSLRASTGTPTAPPADSARPFDPPRNVAKFAAQAASPEGPRDAGDAERNLRAALATLQRMGGGA